MFFEGLKENNAVALNSGKFIVALIPGEYKISGNHVTVEGPSYAAKQILVDTIEDIYKQKIEKGEVIHFVPRSTDATGSISTEEYQEFNDKITELLKRGYDYDEDCWVDFYKEAECKDIKQQQSEFRPVFSEPQTYFEKLNIECVLWSEDTGSSFIETPFRYGKVQFNNSGGIYKVQRGKIVDDVISDARSNAPGGTIIEKGSSGNSFLKINGKYVWPDSRDAAPYIKNSADFKIFEDLEEAQAEARKVRTKVQASISIAMYPNKETSPTAQRNLLETLQSLQTSINAVVSKVRTEGSLRSAKNKVNQLIDILMEDSNDSDI